MGLKEKVSRALVLVSTRKSAATLAEPLSALPCTVHARFHCLLILTTVSETAAPLLGRGYRNQSLERAVGDKVTEVLTNRAGVQTQPDLNSRTLDFFPFLVLIFDERIITLHYCDGFCHTSV